MTDKPVLRPVYWMQLATTPRVVGKPATTSHLNTKDSK